MTVEKQMLINARQPEEVRIAIVENGKLLNIDIASVDYEQKKANIYKGIVTRVEPSLNAAFINYGQERNGFLPFKEIAPEYFRKSVKQGEDVPLTDLLDVGQEIIVQINKEERGTKGAALSTYITLAGCYLVLMPNNPDAGGISRRIEGPERQKLKELFDALEVPDGMGVIIRTAGVDRQIEEIEWDLNVLLKLWEAINKAYDSASGPFLIHSESDITVRAIRDHLKDDIQEIIVDSKEAYDSLKRQLSMLRPDFVERVKLYDESVPLFSKEQIESRIEEAYKREVVLPSGGSIVIDSAEALTAIDINSARATRGDNIEETAYFTNLEAAEEISRQLRLRDIGGLIVIDFIDMQDNEHQRNVEHALIDELAKDRAKVQMTRISKFGLVEVSRQRLQSSLGESATISCPRCEGQGIIRSVPSLALSILRLIKEEAHKEKTNEIRVQLPIPVATYLLNEKRDAVKEIESELDFKLVLIPNPNLETPHYYIQRIWGDNYVANKSSYNLIEERKEDSENYIKPKKVKPQQPAVKSLQVEAAPKGSSMQKEGLFKKIWSGLFGSDDTVTEKPKKQKTRHENKQQAQQGKQQGHKNRQHQKSDNQQRSGNRTDSRKRGQQYGARSQQRGNNKQSQGDYERDRRQGGGKYHNQKSSNSPRQNIHKSEEVIDVKLSGGANTAAVEHKKQPVKKGKKQTVIKSADALVGTLNVSQLEFNTTSKLVQDPKARMTKAVEKVLSNSTDGQKMQQVETLSAGHKEKYLKFESVDLQDLKRKQLQKEKAAKKAREKAERAKLEAENAKLEFEKAQKQQVEQEVEKAKQPDNKPFESKPDEVHATKQNDAVEQRNDFTVSDEAVISIDVSDNKQTEAKNFEAEVEIVVDVDSQEKEVAVAPVIDTNVDQNKKQDQSREEKGSFEAVVAVETSEEEALDVESSDVTNEVQKQKEEHQKKSAHNNKRRQQRKPHHKKVQEVDKAGKEDNKPEQQPHLHEDKKTHEAESEASSNKQEETNKSDQHHENHKKSEQNHREDERHSNKNDEQSNSNQEENKHNEEKQES
ncbi:Rne/Rng family ribonuclease [Thiotrichales bacterium 19S9-12]|nr:Rne/Rng family ribonuclease [Thiotrichales bacterium 19S9-11]MCF6811846.1 Rne/Rng family ribonuclease [Thiotrichales bacterium 19S9-12]